jgi:dTDP-3-amino-2,3,6-trideoxy-4-keto-D-glucose/dTDP-3-amino-3,4,6-trideoxy-alpha-D-glucose/dTDP-2,6-dideoxy-D-kanosamine transaminase
MSIEIPVFRFVAEPALEEELRNAVHRVLSSRRYVLGEEVAAFEREFAEFCGTSACIGVANGTDALELALRGVGIAHGDRVATVANAGYYTCTALAAIGAQPVFVDIDETLTLSTAALEKALPDVKAIVVTHLYGRLAAIEEIVALAGRYELPVIEDCAQAHGAQRGGRLAGSFGVAGCFSFYPTKNLGAIGDGGAIVTSDRNLVARARSLRQYGWSAKYCVDHPGGRNSRLDELQAAFLRVKLPRLAAWNADRVLIARRYCEGLDGLGLVLPRWRDGEYVAHLFVVRSHDRDAVRARLSMQGIGTDVHYPIADYRQPVRAAFSHSDLPATEAACNEVLTLPCYPGLTTGEVQRVIDAARRNVEQLSPTP